MENLNKNIKTIIFDFDSTLARSLPEVKKIFLEIAHDLNYKKIDKKTINRLIHKEINEIFKEIKLPLWKLPKIERLFRLKMKKSIKRIKPFPNVKNILEKLKKRNLRLGILTSNDKANVEWFLKKYHLAKYFDFIEANSSFFGKSLKLKKLLKKEKIKRDEVIFIGDEARDIIAAKKNKITAIGAGWGVNRPAILAKYKPDFIANKPNNLFNIIKNLLE